MNIGGDLALGLGGLKNHIISISRNFSAKFTNDFFKTQISNSPAKIPDDLFLIMSSFERIATYFTLNVGGT